MLITEIECGTQDIKQELETRFKDQEATPRDCYAVIDDYQNQERELKMGFPTIQIHAVNRAQAVLIADRALQEVTYFIDNIVDTVTDLFYSDKVDFKDQQEAIRLTTDAVIKEAFTPDKYSIHLEKVNPYL